MSLHNYKKAQNHEVEKWLKDELNLTDYQKSKIYSDEIVRFAPFEFMKRRKRVSNIWFRLSIIVFPIILCLLYLSLPFKFILSGSWGYSRKSIQWFDIWKTNIGL